MTKVTGPSGADFQSTHDVDTAGPLPDVAPSETKEGWLSTALSSGADAVLDRTGADTLLNAIGGSANIALEGVKVAFGVGLADKTAEFIMEGKFNDYTLNPGPALERVVTGANETLKKYGGEDPLQLTTKPKMEDVFYTFEVLTGQAGKLDQLPMAAAALAIGVLHENRAITQTITESDMIKSVKENAGTIMHAGTALSAMCLLGVPSGVAVQATRGFKDGIDGVFDKMDESLEMIRDRPVLAREQAAGLLMPMRERLERMPVGDSYEKKLKVSGEAHEGIGAKLGAEFSANVKKLGEDKYEVTLTGKADLLVGLGLSADSKGMSIDGLAKHQVEIKIEISGEDAAKVIDASGDVTALLAFSNPITALDTVVSASQIDTDKFTMKLTSCDVKFQRGTEGNLGPLKSQLMTELSASTGLAVQGTLELELKQEVPVQVSGLSEAQDRSLQDCLKALIEPTNNKVVKAEGKVRFDGDFTAEFKLEATSDANRIEAEIKVDIKDPNRVAEYLGVSKADLKQISPQLLFDKLGSLPPDAVEVSVSLTGHESYMGARLAIPPAEYSAGSSHPTSYLRIPDPDFPNRDLAVNLAEARKQIVALSEGWTNERPVSLKA